MITYFTVTHRRHLCRTLSHKTIIIFTEHPENHLKGISEFKATIIMFPMHTIFTDEVAIIRIKLYL